MNDGSHNSIQAKAADSESCPLLWSRRLGVKMKYGVLFLFCIALFSCANQGGSYSVRDFDGKCNTIIAGTSNLPKYDFEEVYPTYVPSLEYPRIAKEMDVEGFAVIIMDVEVDGTVTNVRLAESCPGGYFEKEALKVAKDIRWNPRKIDGNPVRSPDVPYKFDFNISESLVIRYEVEPEIFIIGDNFDSIVIKPDGSAIRIGDLPSPIIDNDYDWETFHNESMNRMHEVKYSVEQYQEIFKQVSSIISATRPSNESLSGKGFTSFSITLWGNPNVDFRYNSIGGEDYPESIYKLIKYIEDLGSPNKPIHTDSE